MFQAECPRDLVRDCANYSARQRLPVSGDCVVVGPVLAISIHSTGLDAMNHARLQALTRDWN